MDYLVDNNTVAIGSGDTPPLTGTPGEATAGNPAATPPVPATKWPAWAWNMILGACRNVIVAAGLTPNRQDRTLLAQAVGIIGTRVAIFSSNGSFTVPAGVYNIEILCWAAGGGSGGTYGSGSASLGGGGGGFAWGNYPVTPGQVIPIAIGAGGTAGVGGASPTAGGPGGTSSAGTLLSATGGLGGVAANGTNAPSATSGGAGFGGNILNAPGCSSSGTIAVGSGAVVVSEGGAAWGGLSAHWGSTSVSAAGVPGLSPGGGAAGSAAQANGAAGAGGLIIVRY